jgi:Histidine kinase
MNSLIKVTKNMPFVRSALVLAFLFLISIEKNNCQSLIHIDSIQVYGNYAIAPYTNYNSDLIKSNASIKHAIVYFHSNLDSCTTWFYQTDYSFQWLPIGNQKWFVFHNLPPGEHTLSIIGRNYKGETLANHQIKLSSPMPVWENGSFALIAAFCLFVFASSLITIFYGQKIRQEKRMNAMRQRIAFDLHDEIGATLGSISLLGEWTKKKIDTTAPHIAPLVNPKLESLVDQTRNILEELRIVIWAVNPNNTVGTHFLSKIKALSTELLEPADIEINLKTDEKIKKTTLLPLENQQLISFIRECFHNTVKHAKATKVNVDIFIKDDNFILSIVDNGIGFDTMETFQGFGLKSLEDRSRKLGGSLKISSYRNQGTDINLVFQLGKIH